MVTNEPGIALGVLTADCAPIVFAEDRGKVLGVAHAGWKGALAGVAESTVEAMEELGAKRSGMTAVIGPTISAAAYEVGPEFHNRFLEVDAAQCEFLRRLPAVRPLDVRSAGLHCTSAFAFSG